MTIDVAMLRELHYQYDPGFESTPIYCFSCMDNVMDLADAEWPCPTTELLDAYEERDRLRDEIERAAQLAVEAKNTILKLRGALDLAQTANRHYASLVRGAALEGRE